MANSVSIYKLNQLVNTNRRIVAARWQERAAAATISLPAMEIYFQLISNAESLKKACDELKNEPYLGFDVETTDLEDSVEV